MDISPTEWKFDFKNFVIDPDRGLTPEIAQRIFLYHMVPGARVRALVAAPIWPSKKSCYRHKEHERNKGRAPTQTASGRWSQHTFDERDALLGATDWTTIKSKFLDLARGLIAATPYTRLAVYPGEGFIHSDHFGGDGVSPRPPDRKFYHGSGSWTEIDEAEFMDEVANMNT